MSVCCVFFFFKQKTAYEMRISDWSSDVCSSDLLHPAQPRTQRSPLFDKLIAQTKDQAMYTPLTIANTLITLNWNVRPAQNPMWLNKMVYIVHGWSLAYDRSVVGELPQVWQHGPIYASLSDDLRAFRNEPVLNMQTAANSRTCPTVPDTDLVTLDLKSEEHTSELQSLMRISSAVFCLKK